MVGLQRLQILIESIDYPDEIESYLVEVPIEVVNCEVTELLQPDKP